jgi:hypothetical protein
MQCATSKKTAHAMRHYEKTAHAMRHYAKQARH